MDNIRNTEWLLFLALIAHVALVPFTKVEESFNIQAIHDILYHRANWTQYDHLEFPGVVPRTFMGPLAISSIFLPIMPLIGILEIEKYFVLFIVRIILGALVLFSFCAFARAAEKCFGQKVGTFLRLFTLTQFHFMFYASRPLPNTFAMSLVLLVYQKWLDKDFLHATAFATVATIIFRFELVLLFGPLFLITFIVDWRSISPFKTIIVGVFTLIIALAISIPIDSFFWGRWIWPEGKVIHFNIWLNRSHEYGVSPFWWYFTSALPRAMLFSLLLVPLGLFTRQNKHLRLSLLSTTMAAFCFLIFYSFLSHKELRFILYVVPLLNLSSAVFSAWIWDKARQTWPCRFLSFFVVALMITNVLCTSCFLYASALNYPGGVALMKLQHKHRFLRHKPITVHIDTFCAETGISRFLQLYDTWEYDKTEHLTASALAGYDYLLIGNPKGRVNEEVSKRNLSNTHIEYFPVDAFHKVLWEEILAPKWLQWFPIKFKKPVFVYKPKVMVMKNRNE